MKRKRPFNWTAVVLVAVAACAGLCAALPHLLSVQWTNEDDQVATSHHSMPVSTPMSIPDTSSETVPDSMPAFVPDTSLDSSPIRQSVLLKNVPLIPQFPSYPTGCEVISAIMALRHTGEKVSVDTFIDRYLPMNTTFYTENGKVNGPSPYDYFIGDPRTEASYGCMAPAIEKALCAYFGGAQRVKNTTGQSLSTLCHYVNEGIPVLTWVTIYMMEITPTNSWYLSDGTRFTWPGNEHCMLLVGYDKENYYFNDPYSGQRLKYSKERTESRYTAMGSQSLVVLPAASSAE